MENTELQILTIDTAGTRAKIKADGRTVPGYAKLRGLPEGSLRHILNGSYPYNSKPDGVFQRCLSQMKEDGYLVEASAEVQAA